jgi:toluene monooxygenase electron transfer component
MRVELNARNRAYQFDTAPGERLLYAGLAQGIHLPYECGTGTCGTCKARLTAGEVEDLWPEAAGRAYLKQPGEFLMCQASARTAVSLEVPTFVYGIDPGACCPAPASGALCNPRCLTNDVMAFSVDLDRAIHFDAGQFVAIEFPEVRGYRGYSMVNFERGARRLDFLVKQKPGGGVSTWLFNAAREGSNVKLFGPLGSATFFPGLAKNILCIAGGSGIAGMMSILERARQERYFQQHEGHVYFGVRTMEDAFYLEELSAFRRESAERLHVTVALSDTPVPPSAHERYPDLEFDHGLVHEVAARHMKGRYQNIRAYLAGPPPAVDAAIRVLLLQAKLTTDQIRYDKFS